MNVSGLIASYRTDKASSFGKLRFHTRQNYNGLLRRLEADLGHKKICDIRTRDIRLVHEAWSQRGVTMAHSLIGMLRTLCGYGGTMLEDDACITLAGRMGAMRFAMGKPRSVRITADQVIAIRDKAHVRGLHSLALAQAFQFDCMFRQRDVIGEWIPCSEPADSDTFDGEGWKWLRGIRWDEVDEHMILRHVTSKRLKEVEIDLNLASMVIEELRRKYIGTERRYLPPSGPIIIDEATGRPFNGWTFRSEWRHIARACGIPDDVRNMDTRAGAISEATDAGASLELVRHAATHSDVATTARYSRGSADKIAEVMKLRSAARGAA